MPISHEKKIVFIHIPKTGGSSIEKFLKIYGHNNMGSNKIYDPLIMFGKGSQHYSYEKILENSEKDVSEYFSFCFVRNPWDRIVSEFFWRQKHNGFREETSFRDFIYLIKESNIKFKPHFIDQKSFICGENDKILVDFVGRFENFQQDFEHVCKKNDLKIERAPYKNKSERKHYKEYYDEETMQVVYDMYQNDIDFFNYKF